jgi:hypothetical protein
LLVDLEIIKMTIVKEGGERSDRYFFFFIILVPIYVLLFCVIMKEFL